MRTFNVKKSGIPSSVKVALVLLFSTQVQASEVSIPNEFVGGQPALASEVNQNFAATAGAINDNNTRLNTLETALDELATRVNDLESTPALTMETYYATDLLFLQENGDLRVPVIEGNQSAPGVVGEGIDWHPVPALTEVVFNVEEDGTVVIFQTTGEMNLSSWNVYARGSVALAIDGVMPENGAKQNLRMVSDDNVSSGGQSWNLLHVQELNAGMHTFTLFLMGGSSNEGSITIEGRSGPGYDGRVKMILTQIH